MRFKKRMIIQLLLIFYSTISAHDFVKIQFIDSHQGWLLAESGNVLAYNYQSNNWIKLTNVRDANVPKSLFFINDKTGYVLMSRALKKTKNGGISWSDLHAPTVCSIGQYTSATNISDHIFFTSSWHCIIEPFTWAATIIWVKTNDDTVAGTNIKFFDNGFLYDMTSVPLNKKWIVGTIYDQSSQAHRGVIYFNDSNDNFNDWAIVYQDTTLERDLRSISFVDTSKGWVCGDEGLIIFSDDGGQNWTSQYSNTLLSLSDIFFLNEHVGWVVGDKGIILKTQNSGKNWGAISVQTTEDLLSLAVISNDSLWVAGKNNTLLHSFDAGISWNPGVVTTINIKHDIPISFTLHQNYPNPFKPATTIEYELTKQGKTNLAIYNLLGQRIKILVDEVQQPGKYKVTFNTKATNFGAQLAGGIYIFELKNSVYSIRKKMILF